MLGHPEKYGKIRVIIFDDANLLQSSMHVRRIVDSADCCATEYKKFAYITLSKPLTAAEDAISSGLSTDSFEAIGQTRRALSLKRTSAEFEVKKRYHQYRTRPARKF